MKKWVLFQLTNGNNEGAQFIASFMPCLSCSIILVACLVNCTEGQFDAILHRHLVYNRRIQVPQDHFTTEQKEQVSQMSQVEQKEQVSQYPTLYMRHKRVAQRKK
jgi:hypothetical protein